MNKYRRRIHDYIKVDLTSLDDTLNRVNEKRRLLLSVIEFIEERTKCRFEDKSSEMSCLAHGDE